MELSRTRTGDLLGAILKLQAFCKHQPSWRCRHVPDQHTALEQLWLLEADQRHSAARIDHFVQLCKPEVTRSIPVRSIAVRSPAPLRGAMMTSIGLSF
jgi:hypothetical protein